MATSLTDGIKWDPLPRRDRICAFVLGVVLLALAFGILVWPFPTAQEWSGHGYPVKSSRNAADLETFATACMIAAIALLAYAINGVRLLRFGVGSVNVDGSHAADEAREHYERPAAESAEEVEAEGVDPQPAEPPADELETRDGKVAIFELRDVPTRVIRDALQAWPGSAGSPPASLAEFQFASRKRGKGAHPWILKFQGRPEVRVFYGGRGKSGPTVRENEEQ